MSAQAYTKPYEYVYIYKNITLIKVIEFLAWFLGRSLFYLLTYTLVTLQPSYQRVAGSEVGRFAPLVFGSVGRFPAWLLADETRSATNHCR